MRGSLVSYSKVGAHDGGCLQGLRRTPVLMGKLQIKGVFPVQLSDLAEKGRWQKSINSRKKKKITSRISTASRLAKHIWEAKHRRAGVLVLKTSWKLQLLNNSIGTGTSQQNSKRTYQWKLNNFLFNYYGLNYC